jgi:DNA processing protein
VIEAGSRSGAKNTARHTRELGGTVMAVPGPVTSAMSVGCHQLVRECSARLVTSAADVLEEIGRIGEDLAHQAEAEPRVEDELDLDGRRVLDGLEARRPSSPEQVAIAAGVPVGVVLRYLPVLKLVGLAECDAGRWRLASGALRRLRRR